jgi:hypothetical protein
VSGHSMYKSVIFRVLDRHPSFAFSVPPRQNCLVEVYYV